MRRSQPRTRRYTSIQQRPQRKAQTHCEFDIKAVKNTDPSSPYHFKSVSLIIKSQKTKVVKGKRRADGVGQARHKEITQPKPKPKPRAIVQEHPSTLSVQDPSHEAWESHEDVRKRAETLLKWLDGLTALCETNDTVLHPEVCSKPVRNTSILMAFTHLGGERNVHHIQAQGQHRGA